MEHYFTNEPNSAKKEKTIEVLIFSKKLEFRTCSGLFSKDGLDSRSKFMIENVIVQPKQKILDFGCGWGVVGISLLKKYQDTHVTFLDINKRAIELTKKNIELHHLTDRSKVIESDGLDKSNLEKYDNIILNPPLKTGHRECERLFSQADNHLTSGGSFQIVYNAKVEGREFEKLLDKIFGNHSIIAERNGIRVTIARKKSK